MSETNSGIDCLMLAAGKSTRMDCWKMTLPFGESTVVQQSVRRALEASSRVVLVAGFRAAELEALFAGREEVAVVVNPGYQRGMFSSVQWGCRFVTGEAFFLALGDMPGVTAATYRALLDWNRRIAPALAPESPAYALIPAFGGKKGHPLLLSEGMRERILGFEGTGTLREVLAGVPTMVIPLADRYVLQDIDTRADYLGLHGEGE
jgi:molybdenum cofactor cytidylyltransferase